MKKAFLSLIGLTTVLAAGGCSATTSVISNVTPYQYRPTQIKTNTDCVVISAGQTADVSYVIKPIEARSSVFDVKVEDTSVARYVNKTVTGLKAGRTTLTISFEGEIFKQIPIVVQSVLTNTKKAALDNATVFTKSLIKYQDDNLREPEIVKQVANNKYATIKNGREYRYNMLDSVYEVSRKDGFFSLSQRIETRALGESYSNYSYVYYAFSIGEDYQCTIFKADDNVKHRFHELDTTVYAGIYDRYEILCMVLDAFFTRGRKIATDVYDSGFNRTYLYNGEEFNDFKKYGSFQNVFLGEYLENGKDISSLTYFSYREGSFGTLGPADESAFEAPAGTPISGYEAFQESWVDGLFSKEITDLSYDYKVDGDNYSYQLYFDQVNDYSLEEVDFPVKEQYQRVYSISDL